MLILSRKVDQKIIIQDSSGNVIEIMPTEIKGEVVKIGIKAPDGVKIIRAELSTKKITNR